MAARNARPVSQSYVHGNAVRKVMPAQQPRRDTREERRPAIDHNVRRNQEKALHMDLPYVIMLTLAAVCALYICVSYLQVQSSISTRIRNIERLEQDVELLKSENDALQTRINTSVDLEHVYKVATEELGMVYANRYQILLYDKTESEYVRQYEDIPKH